jgi:putative transposase
VHNERKRVEKLRYLHRNPVKRGLVARPEDWPWSSFRHDATGVEDVVEIESEWTAQRREANKMPASGPPRNPPFAYSAKDRAPTISGRRRM